MALHKDFPESPNYPDFLVKVSAKRIIIVETKCQEDLWQGAAPDRNSSAIDSDRRALPMPFGRIAYEETTHHSHFRCPLC
ncbi:MAG: hypothetical protein WC649_08615 [Desulfobacteria bacterium]